MHFLTLVTSAACAGVCAPPFAAAAGSFSLAAPVAAFLELVEPAEGPADVAEDDPALALEADPPASACLRTAAASGVGWRA